MPARKRAPRGANREAVLRVIDERPGVIARELAVASAVTGGTLDALLRRFTDEGLVEKRELPGGAAGYALATSAGAAAAPPQSTSTEAGPGVQSRAAARAEPDRAVASPTCGLSEWRRRSASNPGDPTSRPMPADVGVAQRPRARARVPSDGRR